MKLTNKFNLPQTFVNVIQRPTYSKGKAHISATEIINSPRIVQLKKKYWEEIEQDASEMVWSLFGSAVHNILEHGKDDHHIVEERLHLEFDGWKISGAIDLQEVEPNGTISISDYKVTGAWAVMNEKEDWHRQLNIYAWMVEKVKKAPVGKLQIIAIIRDWSARDAGTKEGYPQSPVATIDIPLWSFEDREAYVSKRIDDHGAALFEMETDGEMPDCTPEEMWEKKTTYALKKNANVRATSVHTALVDAEEALAKATSAAKKNESFSIEIRLGERTRCKSYCQVSQFCKQYQTYLTKEEENVSS
jgi:hypothetical protein